MGLDVLFTSISRSRSRLIALKNPTYIYTQFDAQNAGNNVSEVPDFKLIFLGGGGGVMPPDPPSKRGLWPLVNTVACSAQTGCLLQTLLKPLLSSNRSYGLWPLVTAMIPSKLSPDGKAVLSKGEFC